MKNEAIAVFRRPPERLNCAQAVLHAYQAKTGDCRLSLESLDGHGGGRAPGNLCGALYAALELRPELRERLSREFAERCGSVGCRELKQELRFPCEQCVGIAAELLEKGLTAGPAA